MWPMSKCTVLILSTQVRRGVLNEFLKLLLNLIFDILCSSSTLYY